MTRCLIYTAWRNRIPTQVTISPSATPPGSEKPFHLKCQRPVCSRKLSRLAFDSTPHSGLLEGRPFLSTRSGICICIRPFCIIIAPLNSPSISSPSSAERNKHSLPPVQAMAKATTSVKSRTTPETDPISFPVLTYTDALPRNDLRDINNNGPAQLSDRAKVSKYEFPRPRTADGHRGRKTPSGVAMAASFDFRVTAPPDEVFPSKKGENDSPGGVPRIGVALGSPSMLDSRDDLPAPRFNTEIFSQEQVVQPPLPRKSSKWRKIGGLFKAKHALAMPIDEPKPLPKLPAPKKNTEQSTGPTLPQNSTEEWPIIQVNSKPAPVDNNSSHERRGKLSLSGRKANKDRPSEKGPKSTGLLLEVDIPNVQMERYSVMFSQVMKKNQRPSLLARRSKTLDNVHVPKNQVR